MKDFTVSTIYAILQEFLGGYFWPSVVAILLVAALAAIAVVRARTAYLLRNSALLGLVCAIAAVGAAPMLTNAGFDNLHGALDWIFLAVIGVGAFVGGAVAAYGILGSFGSAPRRAR